MTSQLAARGRVTGLEERTLVRDDLVGAAQLRQVVSNDLPDDPFPDDDELRVVGHEPGPLTGLLCRVRDDDYAVRERDAAGEGPRSPRQSSGWIVKVHDQRVRTFAQVDKYGVVVVCGVVAQVLDFPVVEPNLHGVVPAQVQGGRRISVGGQLSHRRRVGRPGHVHLGAPDVEHVGEVDEPVEGAAGYSGRETAGR